MQLEGGLADYRHVVIIAQIYISINHTKPYLWDVTEYNFMKTLTFEKYIDYYLSIFNEKFIIFLIVICDITCIQQI